jgi:hypothetical protein
MQVFSVVEDALAIVRLPKGVYKQVKVYTRNTRLFVPHGGGFIQIRTRWQSEEYATSHPDVKVVELDCPGVEHTKQLGAQEPRYTKACPQ